MVVMIEYSKDVIWKNGEKKIPLFFRFYEKKSGSNALIVYFHGAVAKPFFPHYNGMGMAEKCADSGHFLLVSDPLRSLAAEFRLAWYTSPYQEEGIIEEISSEINTIVAKKGIDKILFVGGSGATIPLVRVGRYVKNSCFFMWNPQTNIMKYRPGHVSGWVSNLGISKELASKLSSKETLKTSINFKECFKEESNYYCILQMYRDEFHLKNHAKPFYEAITGRTALFNPKFSELIMPNVLFHIGSWSLPFWQKGKREPITHLPPDKKYHRKVIRAFANNDDPKKILTTKFFRQWDVE